ncbi:MAG: UMP kinase [Legionellaceae bacterium]|nr:UMP kinase [Legionellaceae bacterium]|tara:strand:- start:600 stop:1337 length:738 start_codon:yes stop_codon:yes gene_type:complete
MSVKYPRILYKLSGEAFTKARLGVDPAALDCIVNKISEVLSLGVQVGIVIGAGNLIRGADLACNGFDQKTADYMGMIGTVINGMALSTLFESHHISNKLMTKIKMPDLVAEYNAEQAIQALSENNVVIFAGGTGNPFCTTDTAASLCAIDIKADLLIKATTVDGIYTADPKKAPDAKRYRTLNYTEALNKQLAVMDRGAIELCRDAKVPMRIYNMRQEGALKAIVLGEDIGTYVDADAEVSLSGG